MKRCCTCKIEKDVSEFYTKVNGKPHGSCKICWSQKSKKKYKENSDWRQQKMVATKQRRLERLEYVWNYLESHPCVDCGEDDFRVLEFDHVRGHKVMGVTRAIQYSLDLVKQEIEKCDVRCANCHRRKTYIQLGWRTPLSRKDE